MPPTKYFMQRGILETPVLLESFQIDNILGLFVHSFLQPDESHSMQQFVSVDVYVGEG